MPILSSSNNLDVTVNTQAKGDGITKTEEQLSKLNATAEQGAEKTSRLNNSFGNFASTLRAVGEAFIAYQIVNKVENMFSSFFEGAAELEQTNIAFQSLIGNTKEANSVYGQLVQYANNTPFQSKDIEHAAQTLMGFGTAGQQTVSIIKQLGDVVSVGGGNMQQLALVTGQIFAQGKLRAQDMYQVINDGGAGLIKIMAQNVGGMQKLTAEFDSGGIPAQQYFDAITQATTKGGFAFQGAQKEAQTMSGRISTLKDATLQFGMALIGVRIDPQLGLQIQPGGIFDHLKTVISGITTGMQDLQPVLERVIPAFIGHLSDLWKTASKVWDMVGGYLYPSFAALFNTIRNNLIPALRTLWNDVLAPLIPVFGVLLVGVIKESVDILNALLRVLSGVVSFVLTHKGAIIELATVFGMLAAAMKFDVIAQKFSLEMAFAQQAMMLFRANIVSNVSSIVTGFSSIIGLLRSPWIIAFAGAAIAVGLVTDHFLMQKTQAEQLKEAQDRLKEATKQLHDAQDDLAQASLNVEGANLRVEEAQRNYTDAVERFGPKSLEAREALHELRQAQRDLTQAHQDEMDKLDALVAKQKEVAKDQSLIDHMYDTKNAIDGVTRAADGAVTSINNLALKATATTNSVGQKINLAPLLKKAQGGPVKAGQPYIVGDNPDGTINSTSEVFVPDQSGTIVPNHRMRGNGGSGSGGNTFNFGDIHLGDAGAVSAFGNWINELDRDGLLASKGMTTRRGTA